MGKPTVMKINGKFAPRFSTKLLIDIPLLIATAALLIIGLLTLYSASWSAAIQNFDNGLYYVARQALWILIGLVAATTVSFMDYHIFEHLALPILVISILMLLLVMFKNPEGGYTRTVFNNSVQPSEFAKPALIIYMAYWLTKKQENLSSLKAGTLPVFAILAIMGILVLAQPDVSAAITIVVLGALMFFIAGGNIKHILTLIMIGATMLFLGYFLFDKVSVRISDFLSGLKNPADASYHIQRSFIAIIRGGIFGVGIGKGSTKITGLPVAWTDSIFAVILEETGLVGGCLLMALYLVILWRGYEIFKKAPDTFGKMLASGITSWIFLEIVINISVMVNIIPFAGNALPLISFGGSSMITTLTGIGILMSISRCSTIESINKGRSTPDAFISLRRRDWGWRVSSVGRHSGSERE